MWHETYDEMIKIVISLFRLDKYRPRKEGKVNDVNFEAHIYFDDAFRDVPGSRGRQPICRDACGNYQRILQYL
ncbi:hypothetical protein PBY51_004909 [Eleginops maclovinus]|uniref:Uncharacterized protein n=1 Tax=Eleginops maclovinus TaxID=56733 RepID=A0AAN8AGW5_ELEMC|nr:hypothetical protein PBY51_004909 [Eleginops maclovinus]